MFKVGDRVKIKKCCVSGKFFNGEAGVIIHICGDCATVEFDKYINGHSDGYYGKKGHCWSVGIENLELLSEIKLVHGIVVCCSNQDDANKFIEEAYKQGFKWMDEDASLEFENNYYTNGSIYYYLHEDKDITWYKDKHNYLCCDYKLYNYDELFNKPNIKNEVENKTKVYKTYDKIWMHIDVDKVIVNEPAVVVILNDGTKSVSKALQGDTFNEKTGYKLSYNKCKIKQLKKQIKKHKDRIKQLGGM